MRDSGFTWAIVLIVLSLVAAASAWLRSCEMGDDLPELPEDTAETRQ